jgi:hypothetical protein
MHWYGWTATTLIGATTRKIPPSLTWILPLAAIPISIYALRFFWRWPSARH